MKLVAPLVAALASIVLFACGSGATDRPDAEARLMLDFQPNAVHAGIYLAEARGFTDAEGVDLRIEVPGDATDAIGLLLANRVQFAVLDIHDLALAREKDRDLVAVMALVQRPLAAVFADEAVRSPRDLVGRRVGVTGLPSDDAVLDSIVSGADGEPAKVRRTTIGFDAVRALLAGKVDAATAFWNVEGVALKAERPRIREFRVDNFGAPPYPELVLVAKRTTLQDSPALVQATVTALRRGYREVILGPEEAVGVLVDRADGLERRVVQDQLDAVIPAFTAGGSAFGALDLASLEKWAAWEERFALTEERPDVARMFDPRFALRGVISG
jgi:putative hydroxymethylpyrimidine transport system substrate-binding protein